MQDIVLSVVWVYLVFSIYRRRPGFVYDITFNLLPLLAVLAFVEFYCDSPINNTVISLALLTLGLGTLVQIRVVWVSVVLFIALSFYCFDAIYVGFTLAVFIPVEIACLIPQKRVYITTQST